MYENGLGLERDFHLAKRMYDMCLATNSGGYVPVQLALTKLYFKWVYMWLTGQSKSGNPFTPQVEDLAQVQRKKVSPPSQPRGAPTTEDDDMDDILSLTDDFEDDDGLGENSLILFLALVGAFLLYWRHRVAEPPVPLPAPAGGPVPIFQQQEEPRQAPRNSVPLVQTEQAEEEPLLREELMPDSQGETLLRERRPFVRDAEEEQQDEDDQDDRKSAGHLS